MLNFVNSSANFHMDVDISAKTNALNALRINIIESVNKNAIYQGSADISVKESAKLVLLVKNNANSNVLISSVRNYAMNSVKGVRNHASTSVNTLSVPVFVSNCVIANHATNHVNKL